MLPNRLAPDWGIERPRAEDGCPLARSGFECPDALRGLADYRHLRIKGRIKVVALEVVNWLCVQLQSTQGADHPRSYAASAPTGGLFVRFHSTIWEDSAAKR